MERRIQYELAAQTVNRDSRNRDSRSEFGAARYVGDVCLPPGTVLAELKIIDPLCTPHWLADTIRSGIVTASTTESLPSRCTRYEVAAPCRMGGSPVQTGTVVAELTMIDPNCDTTWWVNAIRSGLITESTTRSQREPVKPPA